MLKKINRVFKKNLYSMCNELRLPFSLISFFKDNTDIQYNRIILNLFVGKFINMVVMFMPLKILFVLSGAKNIGFFNDLEQALGRNNYLTIIIGLLIVLFIGNAILQVYKVKLINRQKEYIKESSFWFRDKKLSIKNIVAIYPSFCQVLSDFSLMIVTIVLLFFINMKLAVFYLLVLCLFLLIYEQWFFSKHETRLLTKINIDKKDFVNTLSKIMYLILFLGIVYIVLSTNMNVIVAILALLLVRLSNAAFKSYLFSHSKLRNMFLK